MVSSSILLSKVGLLLGIVFMIWSYVNNTAISRVYEDAGTCLEDCICPNVTIGNTCDRIELTGHSFEYYTMVTSCQSVNETCTFTRYDMPSDFPIQPNCTLTYGDLFHVIELTGDSAYFSVGILFSGIAFCLYYYGKYNKKNNYMLHSIRLKWVTFSIVAIMCGVQLYYLTTDTDAFYGEGTCPEGIADAENNIKVSSIVLWVNIAQNTLNVLIACALLCEHKFNWESIVKEEIDFELFDVCHGAAKGEALAKLVGS